MFFICMLMPASISILIEKKIDKTNKSTSDLILKYLFMIWHCCLINILGKGIRYF